MSSVVRIYIFRLEKQKKNKSKKGRKKNKKINGQRRRTPKERESKGMDKEIRENKWTKGQEDEKGRGKKLNKRQEDEKRKRLGTTQWEKEPFIINLDLDNFQEQMGSRYICYCAMVS